METRDWLGLALVLGGGAVASTGAGALVGAPLVGAGLLVIALGDSDE